MAEDALKDVPDGVPGGVPGGGAAERRDLAVRAAVGQGLVGGDDGAEALVCLLDADGIEASAAALRAAFGAAVPPGTPVLHCFAVKAAPLVPVLRLLSAAGIGCEAASAGELALARAAGVGADRTVLDSPAKTRAELREALALGIAVNADNAQELDRIDALMASAPSRSPLGLRVNTQAGAGAIASTSTATATSKFGFALRDPGAREAVVAAYLARPWLTRLHTHAGSQGVPLALSAQGVREVFELAEEVNAAAGRRQIDTIDIGGGLPVDTGSDDTGPTYAEYVRVLREVVPGLFSGRYGLVTEFGRSLLARHGLVLSRVEYTKSSGGRAIAVTHAGVQVATRTVYAGASWPLRILAYDAKGVPRGGDALVPQDVAGPACFSGDLLAEARPLPLLRPGDVIAVPGTGAYFFTAHYAYNSLLRPPVHAFRSTPDGLRFTLVRPAQTLSDLLQEAGARHRDALLHGARSSPAGV
ncbi:diaminopimelate decarboxylase [Streptomyces bambusae]|uniref:diaminopimelate decarboxylase n=1 Tax=Streptomyces bambusae TaxID=1550616 RepID=UPI001CFF21AE|nr:diaminopimelate decarboxylase [Streptomyces bambusae]MCB5166287.1 diaminopimelate decarboxylase [Streptomyces bambusae]